jgi:DNA-directed RNA polymerase specialized sigma24 family protein
MAEKQTSDQHLAAVTARARELAKALTEYQRALVAARRAGVPYPHIAEALGMSESGVRWRCATAQNGGEIHLQLEPLKEQGAES